MALLKCLVAKNELPGARGSLSTKIPSHVILQMNSKVAKAINTSTRLTGLASTRQQTDKECWSLLATIAYLIKNFLPSFVHSIYR